MITHILNVIDWAVNKYLSWRTDHEIKHSSHLQELGIKEFNASAGTLVVSHPGIAIIADEMAQFLHDSGAGNYVQFDMMPRVDRHIRPVRVTVQWAEGLSPSAMVERLQEQLDALLTEKEPAMPIQDIGGEMVSLNAELDRLRAENEQLREENDLVSDRCQHFVTETERLTRALTYQEAGLRHIREHGQVRYTISGLILKARAALEEDK